MISTDFFAPVEEHMDTLTQYGRMAEKHWRAHCPNLVRELEATGQLHQMLLEAEEKSEDEDDHVDGAVHQTEADAQQAHDRAREMVRGVILIPPEVPADGTAESGEQKLQVETSALSHHRGRPTW